MELVPCPVCSKPTEPETLCSAACCELVADAWLEDLTKPAFAQALTDDLLGRVASGLGSESISEDAVMGAMLAVAS